MINLKKDSLWTAVAGQSIEYALVMPLSYVPQKQPMEHRNRRFFYHSFHTLVNRWDSPLHAHFSIQKRTLPTCCFHLQIDRIKGEEEVEGAVDDLVPRNNYPKKNIGLPACLQGEMLYANRIAYEEKVNERWIDESGRMIYSIVEILLYNMRTCPASRRATEYDA
jgi:hypothetical protein